MKKYLHHVYRLENPTTGVGVYRDDPPLDELLQTELHMKHSGDSKHPTPFREGLNKPDFEISYNHIISGCRNIKLLKQWFGPFYKRLIKAGYIVAKYRIDSNHIRYSKLQAIFDSKKAIKIRKK